MFPGAPWLSCNSFFFFLFGLSTYFGLPNFLGSEGQVRMSVERGRHESPGCDLSCSLLISPPHRARALCRQCHPRGQWLPMSQGLTNRADLGKWVMSIGPLNLTASEHPVHPPIV